MELDIMWKSRIENKVLLRQMGAGLVDTKRVLINNGKIKISAKIRRKPSFSENVCKGLSSPTPPCMNSHNKKYGTPQFCMNGLPFRMASIH